MSNVTQCDLKEVTFSEAPVVDRDQGVIRGVKILGRHSKNNRVYSDAALNQAAYLYEGLAVNLDHPLRSQTAGDRLVADGFGWLTSVGVRESGVFGDLHFLRSHPQAPMIAEAAERNPRRFGLSHNAVGRVALRDGAAIVEAIDRVHSVDVVQNPATCLGLFESENPTMTTTLHELCERALLPALLDHPSLTGLRLRAVPLPETLDNSSLRSAVLTNLLRGVADCTESEPQFDPRALFVHLQQHLTDEPPAAAHSPVETDLPQRITRLETELCCRGLLEAQHRHCDPERLQALVALPDEAARRALIESWPTRDSSLRTRPASSPPLGDRGESPLRLPEDVRGFVAALR
ncbi:MAG: hypothetical protein EHM42_04060 [Planctomycetaceae bacterium]|nr:MAG: hypothetical protein EHM42_04060 [Planctomycetaceae bacterium]